jgi:hypothetical protein
VGGTAAGGFVAAGTFTGGTVGAAVVAEVPPQAVSNMEAVRRIAIAVKIVFLFILSLFLS